MMRVATHSCSQQSSKPTAFFGIVIEVGRGLKRWESLTLGNGGEPNLLQNIALLLHPAVGSDLFLIVPGIGEFCLADALRGPDVL
jgi:hypothetical protein